MSNQRAPASVFALIISVLLLFLLWRASQHSLEIVLSEFRESKPWTVKIWSTAKEVEHMQTSLMSEHTVIYGGFASACQESPCRLGRLGPVNLSKDKETGALKLDATDARGETVLEVHLGNSENISTFQIHSPEKDVFQILSPNSAPITIKTYKYKDSDCVDISRKASTCVTDVLMDCFEFGKSHWYGGAELDLQLWTLEKANTKMSPYLADCASFVGGYGPVEERMFFNSKGGGIYIEEDIPLFLNFTESKKLCLQARYDNYRYVNQDNTLPELNYTMCLASNVRTIHQVLSDRFISKPTGTPSPDVFKNPIWTTWSQFKLHINQKIVMDYVDQILNYSFPISQVEIDDSWTPKYGDMTFNTGLFPDAKSFVDILHQKNVAITLWVHPFINVDAKAFSYAASKGFLLKDAAGASPALTKWWHGNTAGFIDFSNPDAGEWFLSELKVLQTKYGVDSFKFDAGDANFFPKLFKAHQQFLNQNHYTRMYSTTALKSDPVNSRIEVRTGARTQNLPFFVRMMDRDSSWSPRMGLQSVIPTALFFGIIGYPFVLPDIIGGDSYGSTPNEELYIRWVQANALMPAMQFSIPPWSFKNSTVLEVSRDMVKLHEKYSDLIIQLANQSQTTGFPIMRPLWWIAPTDEAALTVDDQFLLGDDLLVAPVVKQGQTTRRLYLPAGRWCDEVKGQVYDGGKWIDYPVTIRDLPYFSRQK